MIGFPPRRSLVVLILRPVQDANAVLVDSVMRIDLDQNDGHTPLQAATVANCIAKVTATEDRPAVLAVVVADLARLLASSEIDLAAAWAVQAIESEQPWWTLIGSARAGILPDPARSTIADGATVFASRAKLEVRTVTDRQQCSGRVRYRSPGILDRLRPQTQLLPRRARGGHRPSTDRRLDPPSPSRTRRRCRATPRHGSRCRSPSDPEPQRNSRTRQRVRRPYQDPARRWLVHLEFRQSSSGGGPGAKPAGRGVGAAPPQKMTKRETAHALHEHGPSIE
nr:DUF4192 family protein [Nocardia vulneris]